METSSLIGLQDAMFTKCLLGGMIINSTLSSILDLDGLFSINILTHLWADRQLWRLGIWQLACGSFTEVLFASLALYKLSTVERLMGTRKFASFLTLTVGATSIFVPLVLGVIVQPYIPHANILASGLTPTIFTILHQYHAHVPATALLRQRENHRDVKQNQTGTTRGDFSLTDSEPIITDKTLMYAIGAQIAMYRTPSSLVGAVVGWFLGMAYHRVQVLNSWRLPNVLTRLLERNPVGIVAREQTSASGNGDQSPDFATSRQRVVPSTTPLTISSTDIESLVNMMSVSNDVAREALIASDGSIERAIDNLLSQ